MITRDDLCGKQLMDVLMSIPNSLFVSGRMASDIKAYTMYFQLG